MGEYEDALRRFTPEFYTDPYEARLRRLAIRHQLRAAQEPEKPPETLGGLARKWPGRFFRAPFKALAGRGAGLLTGPKREFLERTRREGEEEVRGFYRATQEYLGSEDRPFRGLVAPLAGAPGLALSVAGKTGEYERAIAASALDVAGYLAQGLVTGPPAFKGAQLAVGGAAKGLARLGAGRAAAAVGRRGVPIASSIGAAAENVALESLEAGDPLTAGAAGGLVGWAFGHFGAGRAARRAAARLKTAPTEAVGAPLRPSVEAPRGVATLSEREIQRELVGEYLGPERRKTPPEFEYRGPERRGRGISEVIAGKRKLRTRWAVVDIDDTIPSHDANLKVREDHPLPNAQNRMVDTAGREASELKVSKILNELDPEQLAESRLAANGAPIVLSNGAHLTGNHRWIALKRGYDSGHQNMPVYRAWLESNAGRFGLDPEDVAALDRPMLVRVVEPGQLDVEQAIRFAEDANVRTTAALKPTELAIQDARRIRPATWALYAKNADANLNSASNRPFARAFAEDVGLRTEEIDEFFSQGRLSTGGIRRMRAAVLARAYRNPDLVQLFIESPDPKVRNIGRALEMEGPRMAQLETLMELGERQQLSIARDISEAVDRLEALRESGQSAREYLEGAQARIAGTRPEDQMAPEALELFKLFEQHKRQPMKIADSLERYAELVDEQGNPKAEAAQGTLGIELPERPSVTRAELLRRAIAGSDQAQGEMVLAEGPEARASGGMGLAEPGMEFVLDALRHLLSGSPIKNVPVPRAVTQATRMMVHLFSSAGEQRYVRLPRELAGGETGRFGELREALPPEIATRYAEKKSLSEAQKRAHALRHGMNTMDLTVAVRRHAKNLRRRGIPRTEQDVFEQVLDVIEGGTWEGSGLPDGIRVAADQMREHVDELTDRMLDSSMLTKELRRILELNRGAYVRRGVWGVHGNPGEWERIVTETERWRWDNMRDLQMELYHPNTWDEFAGDGEAAWRSLSEPQRDTIEGRMFALLRRSPEIYVSTGQRTLVPKKGLQWTRQRKRTYLVRVGEEGTGRYRERLFTKQRAADQYASERRTAGELVEVREQPLPRAFDDFMGLSRDPRDRVGESIMRMAHDVVTHELLVGLSDDLYRAGLLSQEISGKLTHRIQSSRFLDPLAGPSSARYTTPEIGLLIEHVTARPDYGMLNIVFKGNALVRAGKTVGAPQTHFRNFVSWIPLMMANGHLLGVIKLPRAAAVVLSGNLPVDGKYYSTLRWVAERAETITGRPLVEALETRWANQRELYVKAVELGVIQEAARAGEVFDPLKYSTPALDRALARMPAWVRRAGVRTMRIAEKLYTGEDDVGKMASWLLEAENYYQATDMTAAEALEYTAPIVRGSTPTYSKSPKGVRLLRDLPVVSDYPTWSAEIIRNVGFIVEQAAREIGDDRPLVKKIGYKRLAGLVFTTQIPRLMAIGYRAYSGATIQDQRAAQEAAAPWNRNSDLVILKKERPGLYRVIDVSYQFPLAVMSDPVNAFVRTYFTHGGSAALAAFEAAKEAVEPFAGISMIAQAGTEVLANEIRHTHQRIYHPKAPLSVKTTQALAHSMKRLAPGAYGSFRRLLYAGAFERLGGPPPGAVDPLTQRTYNLRDELTAIGPPLSGLPGARLMNINVFEQLERDSKTFARELSDARGDWKDDLNNPGLSGPQKMQKRQQHEQTIANAQNALLRKLAAYQGAPGVENEALAERMRDHLKDELMEGLLAGQLSMGLLDDIEPRED